MTAKLAKMNRSIPNPNEDTCAGARVADRSIPIGNKLLYLGMKTFKRLSGIIPACLLLITLSFGFTPSRWTRILEAEALDTTVNQILLVKCGDSTCTTAEYYVREGGRFLMKASCKADIGKNGIGKQREGDCRTPEGDFGIGRAFGILPDPGTKLEYINVTESVFACDEEGKYYNTIIDTVGTGHECHGEHMIRYTKAYAYGIEIGYNRENVYPRGSAIFLHCKGDKSWTHGCVAVDREMMRTILLTADSGMRISIHPR